MEINGYKLLNEDKIKRAAEGQLTDKGEHIGGVGYEDQDALLAQYDKLGGLIKNKEGYKVKTGSFFDHRKNVAIAKPNPTLVVRVNGQEVEVPEGKPMPREVEAQNILNEAKAKKARKPKVAKPQADAAE